MLGSGLMGGKLGTLFARAGHEVVFSYARSEHKLRQLARETQGHARAGTPAEAAREAEALLLAVHWSRVDDVLQQAGELTGKALISCSLPMNANDTALAVGHSSSGAEERAHKVRRARVVVDAGPLRIARYIEPFSLLVAELAYEGSGGPQVAYRFERFERKALRRNDHRAATLGRLGWLATRLDVPWLARGLLSA